MAALTITVANVLPGAGAILARGIAGASVTAGQSVYLDSGTNTLKLADANASAATAAGVGITAHAALPGQPLNYYTGGVVAFGAILTVGETYFVGATAGDISASGDVASGWYPTRLGYAITTSNLQVDILSTGVLHG